MERRKILGFLGMLACLGCAYGMGSKIEPPVAPAAFVSFSQPISETKEILEKEAPDLKPELLNTVLAALECANEANLAHNSVLAIIDYSLPSNEKRLWIFDLAKQKLLFHTYVSHGFNSGLAAPQFFSNAMNSKSSSLGLIQTQQTYQGRYGDSLKLAGLDGEFNNDLFQRFVVMHGTWYVSEDFIKKYGRAGRSWGCPTVSLDLVKPITEALKDNALVLVYYPEKKWINESKFLNCTSAQNQHFAKPTTLSENLVFNNPREKIMFVDLNNDGKLDEKETILAIKADDYRKIFNTNPPLEQMLRRQINNEEYIALSDIDLKKMSENKLSSVVYFIIPVVKMEHGYYATEMQVLDSQKIDHVESNADHFIMHFEKKLSVILKSTEQFIRWLGL